MVSHRNYLLIIDDAAKDTQLEDYFAKFDYQIIQQASLSQFQIDVQPVALLINSSLMQIESGVINSLYHRFPVPLIVISDNEDEEMCVRVLEAGADDFLVKPIHPRELHARIGAISRRVRRSLKEAEQEKDVFAFANWRLYPGSRQLFDENEQELPLSAGEYDLLLAFVRQPQRVLGREFLLQITKSSDLNPFDRRIDVQISRLRQKIETDAKRPALIKTIRNGGYLFTSSVLLVKEGSNIAD
jgi:two-component system, OmpR family, response regulator